MDVSSVKTPPVQAAKPPKRTEATQQAPSHEVKAKAPEGKKTPEAKPLPVVNTQGQTTGRILNTSA
ncbi:hypothetical protein [Rhodoferax sp. UBA5149]|uniref:hypothetical protein n=1 Tax=Rhodoferax sp. UBA5149 TaxID=1947379 RepID=UPI0025F387C5|nr:hypothetical protein [Rhodoferax sp. UBA5149]